MPLPVVLTGTYNQRSKLCGYNKYLLGIPRDHLDFIETDFKKICNIKLYFVKYILKLGNNNTISM